jgi:hypothetical protein
MFDCRIINVNTVLFQKSCTFDKMIFSKIFHLLIVNSKMAVNKL